jgi:hypothetical protein
MENNFINEDLCFTIERIRYRKFEANEKGKVNSNVEKMNMLKLMFHGGSGLQSENYKMTLFYKDRSPKPSSFLLKIL